MKGTLKLFLIIAFFANILSATPVLSLEIKNRNQYLLDARGDDGDIYLNRLSVHKKIDSLELDVNGFTEAQWNFDTVDWEKIMIGLKAEKILWNYLCVSQSIQHISGQMLDHMVYDVDSNSVDTTTRIGFYIPFYENFALHAAEEYSVNLEKGRDEYCETIAEVTYTLKDSYSFGIGWRHTDRIHNFDSDYATFSFDLRF